MIKLITTEEAKQRAEQRKRATAKWAQDGNIAEKIKALIATGKGDRKPFTDFDHIMKLFEITEDQLGQIRELKATVDQQAKTIQNLQAKLTAIQQITASVAATVEEELATAATEAPVGA